MIHLTQKFKFETDSLEDFERMLETIVHTLFRHQNSEYTKLHLRKKEPSHWSDGSEYEFSDKAVIDVDNNIYTIEPTYMHHGAKRYQTVQKYKNLDAACKDACESKKLPPTRLWVATLDDSACHFKKGEDLYCQSKSQMINRAVHAMQCAAKDKDKFNRMREPEWMTHGDGSVGMGFRISCEYDSGSEVLNLSLCHIYYGK